MVTQLDSAQPCRHLVHTSSTLIEPSYHCHGQHFPLPHEPGPWCQNVISWRWQIDGQAQGTLQRLPIFLSSREAFSGDSQSPAGVSREKDW